MRNEIAELKGKLQNVSEDLSSKVAEQNGRNPSEREMSLGRAQSVEFVSRQYDELALFKLVAKKQIQELISRINEISMSDRIAKSIDALEAYSYQFNVQVLKFEVYLFINT